MITVRCEAAVGLKVLLPDGRVDVINDFDGSFYFFENIDEPILHHTIVDAVVSERSITGRW